MPNRARGPQAVPIGRWDRWATDHPVWAAAFIVAVAMAVFGVLSSFMPDAGWYQGLQFGFLLGLNSAGGAYLRLRPRPADQDLRLGLFGGVCGCVLSLVVLGNIVLTVVITASSVLTAIMSNRQGRRSEAALIALGWARDPQPDLR